MGTRPIEDLERKYHSQLGFLERSAKAFDEGMEDEDVRMAHALRVLFHHTPSSQSIANQLGKSVKLLDTTLPLTPNNLMGEMSLVHAGIGGESGSRIFAPLTDALRKHLIPFENWWSQLVFRQQQTHKFSRKRLVLQLANKEGGSHVDPKLNDEFEEIKHNAFGFEFQDEAGKLERNDVVAATMRQIAHEVLQSLVENYRPTRAAYSFEMTSMGLSMQKGTGIGKIPRNDLCPCESGLKYKKCHDFGMPSPSRLA